MPFQLDWKERAERDGGKEGRKEGRKEDTIRFEYRRGKPSEANAHYAKQPAFQQDNVIRGLRRGDS